tara:strand:- start:494 stop:901 length:408 start_codon:yes stop_codon:yes gene_type:complete
VVAVVAVEVLTLFVTPQLVVVVAVLVYQVKVEMVGFHRVQALGVMGVQAVDAVTWVILLTQDQDMEVYMVAVVDQVVIAVAQEGAMVALVALGLYMGQIGRSHLTRLRELLCYTIFSVTPTTNILIVEGSNATPN